jgi:hypothetical protein
MIELHPEIWEREKEKYVLLPYEEFITLRDLIEDAQDLLALRNAKQADTNELGVSLEDMMNRFGMK